MPSTVAIVQSQLDAYNRRDIAAFVACFDPRIRAFELGSSDPFIDGIEAFRDSYADLFERSPNLHVRLLGRMVDGETVVDHEHVVGLQDEPVTCIAIYRVRDGRICDVWFA